MVAHDLHPGYHSTALARRTGLPMFRVQHHHAHIASCLADNGRKERVIGVAWDGTGYGTDGSVWGGEFLVADFSGFERVGRIRPVALAGGDAAVREPWRMALSHLVEAGLGTERVAQPHRKEVESMIRSGVGTVPTSSAGRLFDAVSSLAGLRHEASYEGQAAIELEAASAADGLEPYALGVTEGPMLELDARPLVREILADLKKGVSASIVGGRFHLALAAAIADACTRIRRRTGLGTVALSGGCFHSRLLTRLAVERLESAGFEVLLHSRVPAGDGGISLGQAAVAAWWLQRPSTRGDGG
jgi:hydrogenase maturation protein HypF